MTILKPINNFYLNIYRVVKMVPAGRVTTYGAIARFLGSPQAARQVGYAMNLSHHQPEYVPAHRVVNRNGILTGKHHFNGPDEMQELLEGEGIVIQEDRIVNFKKHFWDPIKEIDPEEFIL